MKRMIMMPQCLSRSMESSLIIMIMILIKLHEMTGTCTKSTQVFLTDIQETFNVGDSVMKVQRRFNKSILSICEVPLHLSHFPKTALENVIFGTVFSSNFMLLS